jgi:hypothetical protein
MPDTRGTILSDKQLTDRRDNNGTGEAGSPYIFADRNDNTFYDDGEFYSTWATNTTGIFGGTPTDTLNVNSDGSVTYNDNVLHALADGYDNDGDSDDYKDLNGNGVPDFVDMDGDGNYSFGETVEPGVRWMVGNQFFVYADKIDYRPSISHLVQQFHRRNNCHLHPCQQNQEPHFHSDLYSHRYLHRYHIHPLKHGEHYHCRLQIHHY